METLQPHSMQAHFITSRNPSKGLGVQHAFPRVCLYKRSKQCADSRAGTSERTSEGVRVRRGAGPRARSPCLEGGCEDGIEPRATQAPRSPASGIGASGWARVLTGASALRTGRAPGRKKDKELAAKANRSALRSPGRGVKRVLGCRVRLGGAAAPC